MLPLAGEEDNPRAGVAAKPPTCAPVAGWGRREPLGVAERTKEPKERRARLLGVVLGGVTAVRLDVHHVIKRSRGGSDFDLDHLVALCRACHDQTDAPWVKGRLVITPLGGGRCVFDTLTIAPRRGIAPVRVKRVL